MHRLKFEKLRKPIQNEPLNVELKPFMQPKILTLTLNYINTKRIGCITLMLKFNNLFTTKC
jgi:hypothetical protein